MTQLCVFFFSLSLEGHAAVYGWEEIQYKVWWLPVDWKWTQSCIYNFLHQPFYGCFGSLINHFYRFYSFYPTYYQLVCLYIYLTFFKPLLVLLLLSLLLLLLKDGVVVVVIFGYFTVWCFILVLDIGTYTLATYCGVPLNLLNVVGIMKTTSVVFQYSDQSHTTCTFKSYTCLPPPPASTSCLSSWILWGVGLLFFAGSIFWFIILTWKD